MERIVIRLTRQVKRHFRRTISKTKDARLKTRYLTILHAAEAHSHRNIAKMLLCSPSTVDRVRRRFHEEGELGLIDRRGDNGSAKTNRDYILALLKAVGGSPLDYMGSHPCQSTWLSGRQRTGQECGADIDSQAPNRWYAKYCGVGYGKVHTIAGHESE